METQVAEFKFKNDNGDKYLYYKRIDDTIVQANIKNDTELVTVYFKSITNDYLLESKYTTHMNQCLNEFINDNKKRRNKFIKSPINIKFENYPLVEFETMRDNVNASVSRFINANYDINIDGEFSAYKSIIKSIFNGNDISNMIEVYPKDTNNKTIIVVEPSKFISYLSHSDYFLYNKINPTYKKCIECYNPISLEEKFENPYTINKFRNAIITDTKGNKIKLILTYDKYGILETIQNLETGSFYITPEYTNSLCTANYKRKITSKYPLLFNSFDPMLMNIDNSSKYYAEESVIIYNEKDVIDYKIKIYLVE